MDSQRHVAVLAFPFGSHATPTMSLTRLLASSAPNVTFSFFSTATSNAALANTLSASVTPNLTLYDVSDGIPDGHVPSPTNPEEKIGLFMKSAHANYKSAMAAAAGGARVDCISDSFLPFSADLAQEMRATWVSLWTSALCSLSAHVHTDLLRESYNVLSDDDPLQCAPGLSHLRFRDLPEGVVSGDLASPFARLVCKVGREIHRADLVALNTCEGLEPEPALSGLRARLKRCLPIGHLNLLPGLPPEPDNEGCLPWLDRHEPETVVYVSFGSIISPQARELGTLARGLERSGRAFLWSMKEGERAKLPEGFVERTKGRGLMVGWAPQRAVLAHRAVGVFVNHCGWNSVMESLGGGVPMIGRPCLGDHRMNGRIVTHVWRVGVVFEEGFESEEEVVRALEVVLTEGEEMRGRARALKMVCARAVGEGGSSADNVGRLSDLVCGRF
ncbi:hypothetical protein QJS10_CPA02g01457 [Acorus calamus]|uniref:Uncharacterized protein n=1 Tax=Acorus calamus TaxID=4465 RepID=A0AAV9FCN0_ACOCL|nr:hypothetical protein QJS10_CPA02g01457 [Acorus calamus]